MIKDNCLCIIHPEKVRYKAIGMEMNVVESCMKLVALGAKVRQVWKKNGSVRQNRGRRTDPCLRGNG